MSAAISSWGRRWRALPRPELPDDMDARLRAALEKRASSQSPPAGLAPRSSRLLVIVAAIAGPLAWRYLPPSSSTMDQVRAVMKTRGKYTIPTPPESAIARGRMTDDERQKLEREVARSIVATCTPQFALHVNDDDHLPLHAVRTSAGRLAEGGSWPARAVVDMPVGDPTLVRRNWNGSIVNRFGEDEQVGDLFVIRRVDGRWLIDGVMHRGA